MPNGTRALRVFSLGNPQLPTAPHTNLIPTHVSPSEVAEFRPHLLPSRPCRFSLISFPSHSLVDIHHERTRSVPLPFLVPLLSQLVDPLDPGVEI